MKYYNFWELFFENPPLYFMSFDGGETWVGKSITRFPFYTEDAVSYILYKKKITKQEKEIIEWREKIKE